MSHAMAVIDGRSPAPSSSDHDLYTRIRCGDAAAFAAFYADLAPPARRYALRFVPHSDADDVVADTLLAVWQAMRRGSGPTRDPLPYVYYAVRMTAWRLHRAKRAELDKARRALAHHRSVVDDDVMIDPDLEAAVRSLNHRHQLAIWRSVVEGRSASELGEELGISPNAAAALAMRARRALRAAYARLTDPPRSASAEACR